MKNLLIFLFLLLISADINAQNTECLDCHSDDELDMERRGRTVSLFVDEAKFTQSVHGDLDCIDCHEDFDSEEIPHKEGRNIYRVNCGSCHEEYAEKSKKDIHHRLKKIVKNPPGCKTCHGYHEVISPSECDNPARTYCSKCHTDPVIMRPFHGEESGSDESCSECHDKQEMEADLNKSVHKNLICTDCHLCAGNKPELHQNEDANIRIANCYVCHTAEAAEHKESIHGVAFEEGIDEAAQCWDCHGGHLVLPHDDHDSPVNPKLIAATCGTCHDNPQLVEKYNILVSAPAKHYKNSIHGKIVAEGGEAANCTSCHGVHNIYGKMHPNSSIGTLAIPETCGKCHSEIVKEYKESIHWIKAKKGGRFAPVCSDCHTEHGMSTIADRKEMNKLQQETCVSCHQSKMIVGDYDSEGGEPALYADSYHGLAVMRGDANAAMCIDCHGVHKILPHSHQESTISKQNLLATCQKCHNDATQVFAQSYSHRQQSEEASYVVSLVRSIYFWLIVVVIGGMFIHNLIIFLFEVRRRRRREKNVISVPRFTKNEVVQHILLLASFITLAITGFALKYPNSFWAEGLLTIGMTETIRQNTHRAAAVIMITLSIYHLGYLLITSRGRDVLKELLPKLEDIKNISSNLLYYLRINKNRPLFNQYDYAEKAEYWALVWGTIVMGITGLILWFPTIVGNWAPVWFIKVSEIIHFYEAILASLAILVWHWFFVIFHPGEYPMSFTWIDGQMSLEHYRKNHKARFRKMLWEWHNYKLNDSDESFLTHYTKLFFSALEKKGFNPDEVLSNELNKDPELRVWLESKIEQSNSKSD